jgi:hypothetical protein
MPSVLSKTAPYLAVGGSWYLLYVLLKHRESRQKAKQPLVLPVVGNVLKTAFIVDMSVQAAAFLLANGLKTEKFYDLTGWLDWTGEMDSGRHDIWDLDASVLGSELTCSFQDQ